MHPFSSVWEAKNTKRFSMKAQMELKEEGVKNVLIAPIGYISESLETLYDIDLEYSETASKLGITLRRVKCLDYSSLLISAISDAIADNTDKNL